MGDMADLISEMGSKQRDRRIKGFYTDQHDRRYYAETEKENMRPIGEFVLADRSGRFETAPWNPSMTYIDWPDRYTMDFQWRYAGLAQEWAAYTADWYSLAQQLAEAAKIDIPEVGGDCAPKLIGLMGPPPLSPEIPLAAEAGEKWLLGVKGAKVNVRLRTILNLGKAVTSTMAMDVIRARVKMMIDAQEAGESLEDIQREFATSETPIAAQIITEIPDFSAKDGPHAFDPAAVTYAEFLAACRKRGMKAADIYAAWAEHKQTLQTQADAVGVQAVA